MSQPIYATIPAETLANRGAGVINTGYVRPTKAKPSQSNYSAEHIEVLEGLEPVRRRPGKYIGGNDEIARLSTAASIAREMVGLLPVSG